jgi:hypothetical protein
VKSVPMALLALLLAGCGQEQAPTPAPDPNAWAKPVLDQWMRHELPAYAPDQTGAIQSRELTAAEIAVLRIANEQERANAQAEADRRRQEDNDRRRAEDR